MGCCNGSTFAPAPDAVLGVNQRVDYTFGMVLGVDDFRQEHAWLAGRIERSLRETIGYGVISGLDVTATADPIDPGKTQVRVSPGLALCPDGKLVAVPVDQCAGLEAWLAGNPKPGVTSPPAAGPASVYVVLRFAESTDTPVPIPGEPCRDESTLQADSRITDGFTLHLSWTPPDRTEDDALREFAAWLRRIPVNDVPPELSVSVEEFQQAVETSVKAAIAAAWTPPGDPPVAETPVVSPPPTWGSPPEALVIPYDHYAEFITAAFEVWVRKLRALYLAKHGPVPAAEASAETGLVLAAIDFTVGEDGLPITGVSAPAERLLGRPQLLHLRMLQEWLLTNAENDAPREAHYVLGKGDARLPNAQDLLTDFSDQDHALARVDIQDLGGDGSKAVFSPAVKWHQGEDEDPSGDYYGPTMNEPILVTDGGTGQSAEPQDGQILLGRNAVFAVGELEGKANNQNITVENSLAEVPPKLLIDTVQPIHTGASPTFGGLTISGIPSEETNDALVLLPLTSSLLAVDTTHKVVPATLWSGNAVPLPHTQYYGPGQTQPVRVVDGGTGLGTIPTDKQILVGLGDGYVQAEIVTRAATPSLVITQIPTSGNIQIDTVQPLHTKAIPTFQNVRLTKPSTNPATHRLGWNEEKGEVVISDQTGGGTLDPGIWKIRVVDSKALEQDRGDILLDDHVVVFRIDTDFTTRLISPKEVPDGKVHVIKNISPSIVVVAGEIHEADGGPQIDLSPFRSVTVIASNDLGLWLVIARV